MKNHGFKFNYGYFLIACLAVAGCATPVEEVYRTPQDVPVSSGSEQETGNTGKEDIVKISIETTLGLIEAELYADKAPKTVDNFVKLAKKGYYDGIIFHRVIPGFMIQTGDPTGTGRGGPGYSFNDEFHPDLRHNKAGTFSMANAGPNTNGSQFFITDEATPWLDNRHSVFGGVTAGMDVVHKIAQAERDRSDRPLKEIKMVKVTVLEG